MSNETAGGSERRAFFREALLRVVGPVSDYVESTLPGLRPRGHLRPPGAVAEAILVDACRRCGACVEACPADAIVSLPKSDGPAAGTPAIDADEAACVVCTGLVCTTVCPSGALLPVLEPHEISMGLAEVYAGACVRTAGESCTVCVDRCPLGTAAIRFNGDGPPEVLSPGCVGCGICQLFCPTTPKAVVVRPT